MNTGSENKGPARKKRKVGHSDREPEREAIAPTNEEVNEASADDMEQPEPEDEDEDDNLDEIDVDGQADSDDEDGKTRICLLRSWVVLILHQTVIPSMRISQPPTRTY